MGYDSDFTRLATKVPHIDTNAAGDINQLDDNNAQVQANVVAVLQHKTLISGLEISNDTDTENDINIAAGSAVDSTGVILINLTSEMTKRIDAAWAAGDDAGGLDTGSVANTTWYYLYVIIKDSDSSVDALISASKTSPTMPAGYTYFRRIRGAVLTNGSANILNFYQKDNEFRFIDVINDVTDNSPGTDRVLATVSVPPNMIGLFIFAGLDSDTGYYKIGHPDETDVVPDTNNCDIYISSGSTRVSIFISSLVDGSSRVYYRTDEAALDAALYIKTKGFIDPALS